MALTWRLPFSHAFSWAATTSGGSPEASLIVSSKRDSSSARISKGCICGRSALVFQFSGLPGLGSNKRSTYSPSQGMLLSCRLAGGCPSTGAMRQIPKIWNWQLMYAQPISSSNLAGRGRSLTRATKHQGWRAVSLIRHLPSLARHTCFTAPRSGVPPQEAHTVRSFLVSSSRGTSCTGGTTRCSARPPVAVCADGTGLREHS